MHGKSEGGVIHGLAVTIKLVVGLKLVYLRQLLYLLRVNCGGFSVFGIRCYLKHFL